MTHGPVRMHTCSQGSHWLVAIFEICPVVQQWDLRPSNRKQHSQSTTPDGTDWLIRAKQSVAVSVGVPAFHLGAVCNNQRAIGTERTVN